MDWEDIKEKPLIGWSFDVSVLFGTSEQIYKMHRPNGITNFISTYGFIYFLTFFLIMYYSLKKYFKQMGLGKTSVHALFLILILMGFSQLILHRIFTMSLLFIGVNLKKSVGKVKRYE